MANRQARPALGGISGINRIILGKNGAITTVVSPFAYPSMYSNDPGDPTAHYQAWLQQMRNTNSPAQNLADALNGDLVKKALIDPINDQINLHIVDATAGLIGLFLIAAALFQIAKPL